MPRRLLASGANEAVIPWSIGAARYRVGHKAHHRTLVVAARCRIDELDAELTALLDTGAEWSVIGGHLAETLAHSTPPGIATTMSTRLGRIKGYLHRLTVTLVADDGFDCQIAATVFAAPSWDGPPVLGYRGLLERVRLALDPGISSTDQWMYFGVVA